ncbi:MAG: hydroxymethylbilane synthase [Anderseniella sp.]|nr:hydroxymethylbilane synthase [Anderseniella sp.]
MQMNPIRIGTRGSPLALAQAHETRDRLVAAHGLDPANIEVVVISTTGDQIQDRPLAEIGGKGLFTRELEEQLHDGRIDMAVHSMKDMPAVLPEGLEICCLLEREDPRDAFLSPVATSISALAHGAIVGSSSVRRVAQLRHIRPDLDIVPFRGNVQTRLRKLSEGVAAATFLACAGLNRLGMSELMTCPIDPAEMLPAVAQGAIGIEIASMNDHARALLEPLNHQPTWLRVTAERAFLAELDGSCRTPLAGHATLDDGGLHLKVQALTLDGSKVFETARRGPAADGAAMGLDAAHEIRAKAGQDLVS